MKTNYVFMADGFEEVEAMTSIDVMRRAGMNVVTVSINGGYEVTGAHGVPMLADELFEELDFSDAEWLVLPGGMPGATNLAEHEVLCDLLKSHNSDGGKIGAICASPSVVLAPLGLLQGRQAVCYPGMEAQIEGINWGNGAVAVDGNVVTGNGPAAAAAFALTMVAISQGHAAASTVASGMLLPPLAML